MNFKNWLNLIEDYKLHKSYKEIADTKKLGRFGRFVTLYAVKKGHEDRSQEAYELMKEKAPLANQKLTILGFPQHKRNTIVSDQIGLHLDSSPDLWYGTAYSQKHGMDVSFDALKSSEGTNVLIHEYAHMYYFNMPKIAKDYFAKQYEKWFDEFSQEDIIKKDDIDENYFQNVIFHKIKELESRLKHEITQSIMSTYAGRNDTNVWFDFISKPKTKNLVAHQLQNNLHSWFFYNDLLVIDDNTYSGNFPIIPFNFDCVDSVNAENILNRIINEYKKEYNLYKHSNQHETDLDHYVNLIPLKDLIDMSSIKIGKMFGFDNMKDGQKIAEKYNLLAPYWDAFAKKYNLSAPYAASNKDELWAVTVTSAANNIRSVSPLLKNLIVQTLFMSR
jgi:hypothetical protein